jgi:four helix bundle protein
MKKENTTRSLETETSLWRVAHQLVLAVYRYTRRFPKEEEAGLVREFRESATRIASHLAESEKCANAGRKMQLLITAQSQLESCRYFLTLSEDLLYGSNREIADYISLVEVEIPEEIRRTKNNMSLGF